MKCCNSTQFGDLEFLFQYIFIAIPQMLFSAKDEDEGRGGPMEIPSFNNHNFSLEIFI